MLVRSLPTVDGKKVMLMAILWATEEEIFLAKKYPEVFGHDTKACANSTGIPWWYSVGFREDYKTYIAMRGHMCNETQPMFNFVFMAFLYIHGSAVLAATVAHVGDAKNEFINAVRSFCSQFGGHTPNACLLLCGWHLTDRAMHDKFRGTKGQWCDSLYRMFWQWQRAETMEHYNAIYEWFKTTWFMSEVVRGNMPPSARDDALALIDSLHMRREHWALVCNINLPAHDTRVNTFVEIQNACLMDVVQVSKSMGLQTMVAREAEVVERRDRKCSFLNFRTLNTARSQSKSERVLSQVCSLMQDVMTPKVGKKFTLEVQVRLC